MLIIQTWLNSCNYTAISILFHPIQLIIIISSQLYKKKNMSGNNFFKGSNSD